MAKAKENPHRRAETSALAAGASSGKFTQSLILASSGLVFAVSLFLYWWTLAPTVTLVDSGELIVAARTLGVAHPPGFPLYLLLAHLASLVPIGNIAQRVNFASAIFAALACAAITLTVAELLLAARLPARDPHPSRKAKRKSKPAALENAAGVLNNNVLIVISAGAAGLVMAFSRTLWAYATIAEVYTLNSLFILIILFLMMRWRRRILEANTSRATYTASFPDHDYLLYAAAFLFGLALGVHHVTVALILPALAVLVYRTQGAKFFISTRLLYAAVLAIAALLMVYSYLPLAAARNPVLNWGDPRSPHAIWWHMTGRQYQVYFSFASQTATALFLEFARLATRQLGPWCFPVGGLLILVGLVAAFRQMRTAFWLLISMIGCDLAYALSYAIEEDKDAYYLPAFVAFAIAAGLGLHRLLQYAGRHRFVGPRILLPALLAGLLVPDLALVGNWPYNNRRHYLIAQDYVDNILDPIEPRGLLLTQDWQVQSPLLYAREVEQRRRDVKVIDLNLLNRSWYLDYLRVAYPDLMLRSREKVEAFVTHLLPWERDPPSYEKNPALLEKINTTYNEMCQAFVTNELKVAPVYLTSDLLEKTPQNKEITEWLISKYQLVPRGLVFRLFGDQTFHAPGEPALQTRGLADGTLRFENDDVVMLKIRPVYTKMLTSRGRYLAAAGQHDYAVTAFRQALLLDPAYAIAREGLSQSESKLRQASPPPP